MGKSTRYTLTPLHGISALSIVIRGLHLGFCSPHIIQGYTFKDLHTLQACLSALKHNTTFTITEDGTTFTVTSSPFQLKFSFQCGPNQCAFEYTSATPIDWSLLP